VLSPPRQQWAGAGSASPGVAFYSGNLGESASDWIAQHRFPGIWALGESNFYEFTHSNKSAVLVAVAEITAALEAEIRGAARLEDFFFGVLNGSHWAEELKVFNIQPEELGWPPALRNEPPPARHRVVTMTTCADLNAPYSRAELKRVLPAVKAVKFTMFDADTLQGYSVAEIHENEVYRNGLPVHGGVNDPRLGPIDVRSLCESCGEGVKTCPGHWGHLTLARPMFHWGFMKATHNVLRAVCYYCSKLLADPKDLKMHNAMKLVSRKKRLQAVMLCCRAKRTCSVKEEGEEGDGSSFRGGCGYLQPRYFIDATVLYVAFPEIEGQEATGQDRKRMMSAEEALTIFSRISDESGPLQPPRGSDKAEG
ncbi:unnamed protein product, partial [Effrenium voratum]